MEVMIIMDTETLKLTEEWDKTFPKSDKVVHKKITFVNRYGITRYQHRRFYGGS